MVATGSGEFSPEPIHPQETLEQVTERVGGYLVGSATVMSIALADRLGIFVRMADQKAPMTSSEVACALELSERFVRELLFALAGARCVSTDSTAHRFWLSDAQADVLARESGPRSSTNYLAGSCMSLVESVKVMEQTERCFHTGRGMTYDQAGPGVMCGVCRELAVMTRTQLLPHIEKIPGLHERLTAGATVADVGCGYGLALSILAAAYPASTFHGFDTSKTSLAKAAEATSGLDNVALFDPSADGGAMAVGAYDWILTLDAVHDMTRPAEVLKTVREALKEDGIGYLVVDFKSAGSPAGNIRHTPDWAALGYAYSYSLCMSAALSEPGGAGLGTLGWPQALAEKMLHEAGFGRFEVLDWESELQAFYLARP